MAKAAASKIAPHELWRISNHSDLTGTGGLKYSARWHTAGHPVVYLAETPAGALLEALVHLELSESSLPRYYQLLRVSVAPGVLIEDLRVSAGESWKRRVSVTRALGNAWLHSERTPLARVPSAILPHTSNYLLNPRHPGAASLQIIERRKARFDSRLLPPHRH